MYTQNGRVVTSHGMTHDSLDAAYKTVPADVDMALHFRWKTHGDIGMTNNHPYRVFDQETDGTDLWLMHNGVIRIIEVDKTASDTRHWIDLRLRPVLAMNPALLGVPEFQGMLEDGISGSRILFLDNANNWTFLNEYQWKKQDGCLYSTFPPSTLVAPKTAMLPYAGGTHNWGFPAKPAILGKPAIDLTKHPMQVSDPTDWRSFVGQEGDDELDDMEYVQYGRYSPLTKQEADEAELDSEVEEYERFLIEMELTEESMSKLDVADIETLMDIRSHDLATFLHATFSAFVFEK